MHARLLFLLILVAGCMGPGIAPPEEVIKRAKAVHIVAMEAPPLGVPPEFRYVLPRNVAYLASPFLVYNTVAFLIELPAAQQRGIEVSKSFQASLEIEGSWSPTLVLANEVRTQLEARGLAARVAPEGRPMPGVRDRGNTLFMENWMAPIRAWYNDTTPVSDYAGPASAQPQYVLEVGVSNYEIVDGKLLMSVMLKMIDPGDGHVAGRARALMDPAKMPPVGALDQAFDDDAKRFKEIVSAAGRALVKECLTQLRLIE